MQFFEFNREYLVKALAPTDGDDASAMRLAPKQFTRLISGEGATLISETRLSLVQDRKASYNDHRTLGVRLDLEIGAEVHTKSEEVTLETQLRLSNVPEAAQGEKSRGPAIQDLQTSMRLANGTTYLLTGLTREPLTTSSKAANRNRVLVVALTPQIVRAAGYEAGELEQMIVGTESRISYGKPLDALIDRFDPS